MHAVYYANHLGSLQNEKVGPENNEAYIDLETTKSILCHRHTDIPPKMSTSSSPEPAIVLLYKQKGLCRCLLLSGRLGRVVWVGPGYLYEEGRHWSKKQMWTETEDMSMRTESKEFRQPWKLERTRQWNCPWSLRRNRLLTSLGLLSPRTVENKKYCFGAGTVA